MLGKGIPRSHYEVEVDGMPVGHVSSGMYSPTFKKPIGLALLNIEHCEPGSEIDIIIRNQPVKARVEKGIFYRKKTKSK
jgi:aminomethyltransferase